jgi:hypothetical protein
VYVDDFLLSSKCYISIRYVLLGSYYTLVLLYVLVDFFPD